MSKFWEFKNKGEKTGELFLYSDIASSTWWGDEVTPQQFKSDLDGLGDIDNLNVFINSNGGDVFAGQAIHSMLKRHKAYVTVFVDGLAASIASVIAMAGDKIVMPENSMMMIHRAWTGLMGNSNDMRKMADDLEKIDESIIQVYETKTKQTNAKIIELMDAETWLTAKDALDLGFADEIEKPVNMAACLKDKDFSKFKNAPKFIIVDKPIEPPAPIDPPDTTDVDNAIKLANHKLDLVQKYL